MRLSMVTFRENTNIRPAWALIKLPEIERTDVTAGDFLTVRWRYRVTSVSKRRDKFTVNTLCAKPYSNQIRAKASNRLIQSTDVHCVRNKNWSRLLPWLNSLNYKDTNFIDETTIGNCGLIAYISATMSSKELKPPKDTWSYRCWTWY